MDKLTLIITIVATSLYTLYCVYAIQKNILAGHKITFQKNKHTSDIKTDTIKGVCKPLNQNIETNIHQR